MLSIPAMTVLAASLPASSRAQSPVTGPLLWLIERDDAKAYLLGFGDALNRSWFTPKIREAFEASHEVWFEAAPADNSAGPPVPSPVVTQHGFDQSRDLFAALDRPLSRRLLAAAERYGLGRARLEHTRPWFAYFLLNGAYIEYSNQRGKRKVEEYADQVLSQLARTDGKRVRSEWESGTDILTFFAGMSDRQQAERLTMLLDFIEDDERGKLTDIYDWIDGRPSERYIERMRRTTPTLYVEEHVRRNLDWASRIAQRLLEKDTYFVALGLNHVVGPDSVQVALRRMGHDVRRV